LSWSDDRQTFGAVLRSSDELGGRWTRPSSAGLMIGRHLVLSYVHQVDWVVGGLGPVQLV